MIESTTAEVNACTCGECGHAWKSLTVPLACPQCRSRKWNGGKQRGRPRLPTTAQKTTPARPRNSAKLRRQLPEYADSKW